MWKKATFVCNGINHELAAVPNSLPWDQQCVFRFDDLSALIIHTSGSFNAGKFETKGAGSSSAEPDGYYGRGHDGRPL